MLENPQLKEKQRNTKEKKFNEGAAASWVYNKRERGKISKKSTHGQ